MPYEQGGKSNKNRIERSKDWEEMLEVARKLSAPFPHVRVDFFNDIFGRVMVGELTFCDSAGHVPYNPVEWDYRLGNMLVLPEE